MPNGQTGLITPGCLQNARTLLQPPSCRNWPSKACNKVPELLPIPLLSLLPLYSLPTCFAELSLCGRHLAPPPPPKAPCSANARLSASWGSSDSVQTPRWKRVGKYLVHRIHRTTYGALQIFSPLQCRERLLIASMQFYSLQRFYFVIN